MNDDCETPSEEHLRSCARCRAELAALAPAEAPRAGWDDLQARLERARQGRLRDIRFAVIVTVIFGGSLVAARGFLIGRVFDAFGSGLATGLLVGLAIVVGVALFAIRRRPKDVPGTELVASLRRYYLKRIRGTRFASVMSPLFILWLAFMQPKLWGPGTGGIVLRVVVLLVTIALALNARLRIAPRLERELRDLEGR